MPIYQPEADTIEYNTVNAVRDLMRKHEGTLFALLDAVEADGAARWHLLGLLTCLNDMSGTFPPRHPQIVRGEEVLFGYVPEMLDERHASALYFYPEILERARGRVDAAQADAFGRAMDALIAQSPVLREIVAEQTRHYAGAGIDDITVNFRQPMASSIEPWSVDTARAIVAQYGETVRDVLFLLRIDSERKPSIKKLLNTETSHGIMWHMLGAWTCLNDVAAGFPPRLPSKNDITPQSWDIILSGGRVNSVRDERYFEGMLFVDAALSRAHDVSTDGLCRRLDGLSAAITDWVAHSPVLSAMVETHANMHGRQARAV